MKSTIKGHAAVSICATLSEVWDALTKPELIKQYLFGTDTITDWKPGHSIKFKGECRGKKYEDKGTVLDILANSLIKYSYWSSTSGMEDKPENYVIVTYELSGMDYAVNLLVLQENILNEKMKAQYVEGWEKGLQGLKTLLEKTPRLS